MQHIGDTKKIEKGKRVNYRLHLNEKTKGEKKKKVLHLN